MCWKFIFDVFKVSLTITAGNNINQINNKYILYYIFKREQKYKRVSFFDKLTKIYSNNESFDGHRRE